MEANEPKKLTDIEVTFLDYLLGVINPPYAEAGKLVKDTRTALGYDQWDAFAKLWKSSIQRATEYNLENPAPNPESAAERWALYLATHRDEQRRPALLTPDYPVPVGPWFQALGEEEWRERKKKREESLAKGLCPFCWNKENTKQKKIFNSRAEAAGYAVGYSQLNDSNVQREYLCPHGYGWHLTTQEGGASCGAYKAIVTYAGGERVEVSVPTRSLEELTVTLFKAFPHLSTSVERIEWSED